MAFDAQTKAADALSVTLTVNGQSKQLAAIMRQPNRASDSLEITLDSYVPGATVVVAVSASATSGGSSVLLGKAQAVSKLNADCTAFSLSFSSGDGGLPDGPAADGSTNDAPDMTGGDDGPCTAGTTCPVPDAPCHVGRMSCAGGVPACQDSQVLQANGLSCGAEMVCAEGACVACADGAACDRMQACKVGRTSCSTGSPVCMEAGNADDGSMCGAAGMVCADGSCVQCTNGMNCTPTNPCHKGMLSCSGGTSTCNDTQVALDNGTTCGAGQVCSDGACQACKVGMACDVAGQPCRTGLTACNTVWVDCSILDSPGQLGMIEAGHAPAGYESATRSA